MVHLPAFIPFGPATMAVGAVCMLVAGCISAHRIGFARDPPTRGVGAVRHWVNDTHAMD